MQQRTSFVFVFFLIWKRSLKEEIRIIGKVITELSRELRITERTENSWRPDHLRKFERKLFSESEKRFKSISLFSFSLKDLKSLIFFKFTSPL